MNIHYGPVARITTGFFLSTLGGVAYTILQYYAYKLGPCGFYGATDPVCVNGGLVAPITIWWQALPYSIGGISELFINVPAYGIAYSRAPVNMRGLVSALYLLNTGFAFLINLVLSGVITDPYLIWDFGGPAIVGAVVTVFFVCAPLLLVTQFWPVHRAEQDNSTSTSVLSTGRSLSFLPIFSTRAPEPGRHSARNPMTSTRHSTTALFPTSSATRRRVSRPRCNGWL